MKLPKSLIWFISSFLLFHIIFILMWGEQQVYWTLYSGMMLFAAISYIFYQRDAKAKRLVTSIGIGIIVGIALILLQVILSWPISQLSYSALTKSLTHSGVYFKIQILFTLVCVIPCHELYMRAILQKHLMARQLPTWTAIVITAIASSSFFIYLNNWWIVALIFLAQVILSIGYFYTRRTITTIVAQVVAVVLLLIIQV